MKSGVLVDVTASMRRQARREAAAVLLAAGWDYGRIALAFGISNGAIMELMPAPRRVLATPLLAAAAREAGE